MKTRKLVATLALMSALAGCESEPPLLEVYSLPQELGDIDATYIPFEYADTGHTYHTPILAMELAARGIPSVYTMVENCDGEWKLEAPNGDEWGYHQALGVTHEGKLGIVDPVLSSEFLTVDEFRDAFNDSNSRVVVGESSEFQPFQCKDTVLEQVPAKVEDMQPFDFANVMIYCSYMKRFYRDIGGDYAAREQTLVSRIRELSLAMNDLGLLDVAQDDPEFELVKREPYCPPPIPKK